MSLPWVSPLRRVFFFAHRFWTLTQRWSADVTPEAVVFSCDICSVLDDQAVISAHTQVLCSLQEPMDVALLLLPRSELATHMLSGQPATHHWITYTWLREVKISSRVTDHTVWTHSTFLTDNNLPVQLMATVIKVISLPESQENLTVSHLNREEEEK